MTKECFNLCVLQGSITFNQLIFYDLVFLLALHCKNVSYDSFTLWDLQNVYLYPIWHGMWIPLMWQINFIQHKNNKHERLYRHEDLRKLDFILKSSRRLVLISTKVFLFCWQHHKIWRKSYCLCRLWEYHHPWSTEKKR